jgi:hypothetical protein
VLACEFESRRKVIECGSRHGRLRRARQRQQHGGYERQQQR